jgi:hypothetical protein
MPLPIETRALCARVSTSPGRSTLRASSTSFLSTPEEMGDFLAETLLAARLERVSLDDIARQAQPSPFNP